MNKISGIILLIAFFAAVMPACKKSKGTGIFSGEFKYEYRIYSNEFLMDVTLKNAKNSTIERIYLTYSCAQAVGSPIEYPPYDDENCWTTWVNYPSGSTASFSIWPWDKFSYDSNLGERRCAISIRIFFVVDGTLYQSDNIYHFDYLYDTEIQSNVMFGKFSPVSSGFYDSTGPIL